MAQTQSDFVVRVSTQGVEQARRALAQLEKASSGATADGGQAFGAMAEAMERMTEAADKLGTRLERANTSIRRLYRTQREMLSRGTAAASGAPPAGSSLPSAPSSPSSPGAPSGGGRAPAPAPMFTPAGVGGGAAAGARRSPFLSSFGLGALQGMLPGQLAYVQRGSGAIGQMLGMSAGNMMARTAMLPFSGAGGLAQVAGSVPLVGGLLSSSLSRYMGQADSAMSFRRQQMDLMPLLGSQSIAQSLGSSPGTRAATTMGPPLPAGMARLSAMDKMGMDPRTQYLASEGRRMMGADLGQVQGFRASLAAQGGGSDDQMSTAFIRAAMAAKTNLGVGPEVTGAFALGGRTNAFAGKPGADPAEMLLRAMGQADRLGLKGDDAQTYLREIAEGIKQFQQTGMPMQMDSLNELTAGFTSLMGGNKLAAGRAAQGTLANSARFLQNGPQSAFDMQLMRAQGFRGGIASYYKNKLELGTNSTALGEDIMKVLPNYAKGPIEDKSVNDVMDVLRSQGITVSPDMARQYVQKIRSGKGSDMDMAQAIQKARAPTAEPTLLGEGDRAAANVPSLIAKQADMSTAAVLAGEDAASVVQNMEQTAQDVGNVFSRFGTQMKQFTGALQRSVGQMTGGTAMAGPPDTRPAH